jgi:hypothetical protein
MSKKVMDFGSHDGSKIATKQNPTKSCYVGQALRVARSSDLTKLVLYR